MPQPAEQEKSTLLAEQKAIEAPSYSEEELAYIKTIWPRIENAAQAREQTYTEFDGRTYAQYYDDNDKLANTFIEPRDNKADSNFQSGTAREKMFALLAAINNLNLSPDVSAFDENNLEIGTFGEALEDVILKTEEMDADEEKKFLRQYELLKQGTVFDEEIWDEKWMLDKVITSAQKKFEGKIKGLTWISRFKKLFSKPSRNIVDGLTVYLGNLRLYNVTEQPYIFTAKVELRGEAESVFGKWDRWANVPRTFSVPGPLALDKTYGSAFKNVQIKENQVLVIRYQDKWNNEVAIFINGVLMTPVGLPLTLVNGYAEYSITQQNLEPISTTFAYGNSLMRVLRTKVEIFDEMLRLAVLKNQQSYKPPVLNLSGRILSSRIFEPGKVTNGADLNGKIVPVMANMQIGITQGEIAMLGELKEQINNSSVNPTFQGQKTGGDPTATEVVEMQRQAKLVLGLTIFACSMLEWKLAWLRLYNILAKWFDPYDQRVQEVKAESGLKKTLKSAYRRTAVERPIEGEGMGVRMVIPTEDQLPSAQEVYDAEESMKKTSGKATRLIFLNPEEIRNSKLIWQIVIRPREKVTSETNKLMFRAEMADATALFGPMLNYEAAAQRFAMIWGEDPNTFFRKGVNPQDMMAKGQTPPNSPSTPATPAPGIAPKQIAAQ